jgi:hypothetical protein
MTKRFAALLALGLLLCLAFASLLLADGAIAPFHITTHTPSSHEIGVPVDVNILAAFDGDVHAMTLNSGTFVVHGHLGGLASGTFGYGGTRTVTLDPDRAFHAGEVLRVSATDRIRSAGGTPLTPYGWQFTAGPVTARTFAGFVDIGAALTGVYYSSAAWGDYDNDGDLDILLTGSTGSAFVSKVYRNDGRGAFTDLGAALTGVYYSSAAWGDYDNDGDLDILLTGLGNGGNEVSKVYRNDGGAFGFADIGAGLTGVAEGSVAWGDYDNDGDLDILLAGCTEWDFSRGCVARASKVYLNDGGGFFDIDAGLVGVRFSSVAWGDVDNDGDLDILLTGEQSIGPPDHSREFPVSKVYRNDGGGSFADIGAGLVDVRFSSVAWGDVDNDGDRDILLTGMDDTFTRRAEVYRNDGAGAFTDIGAGLTGVSHSSVAWGDSDNDGDLDILLPGWSSHGPVSKVYRNDGASGFLEIPAGLTGVGEGSVAWGDYDNDGDLDILLTGMDNSYDPVSKVYRNNSRPRLDRVVPYKGSGPVKRRTTFETTWRDPDGSADLKQCYFHIGATPALAGNVTLLYHARKNKLWMLDDTGTIWTGGHAPGSFNVLENSQARVLCRFTTVQRVGDKLSTEWTIVFKPGFEGSKKLGVKARDIYNKAKGAWKGGWIITP